MNTIVVLPSIYCNSCILLQQPKVQDFYYYTVAGDFQLASKPVVYTYTLPLQVSLQDFPIYMGKASCTMI